MKRVMVPAALLVVLSAAVLAWGADQVSYIDPATKKEVTVDGVIDAEGPGGIRIKAMEGKQTVVKDLAPMVVRYVVYEHEGKTANLGTLELRQPHTKQGRALEQTRPEKRLAGLNEALDLYKQLDAQLKGQTMSHRYFQWKMAEVLVLQSKDDPTKLDAALAALAAYKTDFNDGWEIVPCLKLLAQMLEDKGDAEGASKAYADLAAVPNLPKEMKQESEIQGVRLLLRVSKFAEAETRLKAMQATLAVDDPQRAFVDVCLVQSQMAQGNVSGAEAQLQAVLRTATEANIRGLAHNLLGDYYERKDQMEKAFWNYLRVDVLYNQDKEEHAKALFHLAKLFDKVKNDPVRAEECLTRLRSPTFAGTRYQRQAGEEKK
jgi:hypothetical protein